MCLVEILVAKGRSKIPMMNVRQKPKDIADMELSLAMGAAEETANKETMSMR